MGWIDVNDWMAYAGYNSPGTGTYRVEYRVASPNGSVLSLDLNAGQTQLGQVNIPAQRNAGLENTERGFVGAVS